MKNILKGLVGIGISAFFVWLTLRHKDLPTLWEQIKSVDYGYLSLYVVLLLGVHLLRTVRWGILLEPLDNAIGFKRLNAASAVGFMLLVILPLRMGEVARPALIADADRKKITFSSALASVAVERVVDGIVMTLLLLGILPFVHGDSPDVNKVRLFGWLFFAVFGGGGVFLVFAYFQHALALKIVHTVGDPISPKLTAKALGIMEAFIRGLHAVPSVSKIGAFLVLTVVYWGLNGYGLSVLAKGFGFELDPLAMYTTLAVVTVGVMIPAGPGMAGVFQWATEVGLGLVIPAAVVGRVAGAYSNVLWAAQFGQQVGLGLLFMAIGHIDVTAAFRQGNDSEEVPKVEEKKPEPKKDDESPK